VPTMLDLGVSITASLSGSVLSLNAVGPDVSILTPSDLKLVTRTKKVLTNCGKLTFFTVNIAR